MTDGTRPPLLPNRSVTGSPLEASLEALLSELVKGLEEAARVDTGVIPWSCPVPCFGDLSGAKIATLGLNPSSREFVDRSGHELDGAFRRFHTLRSLNLARWSDISSRHLELMWDSCRTYFRRNPYDRWFRTLEYIISGTKASYYDVSAAACHLDLIPFATERRWTELTYRQRSYLLGLAGRTLGLLLRESPVRILVLNGSSVGLQLQRITGVALKRIPKYDWSLPRRSQLHVAGFAYRGTAQELFGVTLRHELLVLGFNHNVQSSFGVTTEVKAAIREWIARAAAEAMA